MPLTVEQIAGKYEVRSQVLAVAFERLVDRWEHRISVRVEGRWLMLLQSLEGDAQAPQIPSPVLQDLHFEPLSQEIAEFQLLGQSGVGTYAAVVRFDEARQTIEFDLCLSVARRHALPALVATYRVPPGVALAAAGNGQPLVHVLANSGSLNRPVLRAWSRNGCLQCGDQQLCVHGVSADFPTRPRSMASQPGRWQARLQYAFDLA